MGRSNTPLFFVDKRELLIYNDIYRNEMEGLKMNVLSLFDGMSCGQIALERAGIEYDNYYASEIDKYAIKAATSNYPGTTEIGDICNVYAWGLPKIDLLIGGSPCQGFSFAGKQLNFDDPRSKLFFEYVRLLKECKPKYFLLENVKMKKEYQDIISEYLGVEPIEINSALVSAQNRKRLYWTNIPNVYQPKDRRIYLKDILEDDVPTDILKLKLGVNKQVSYSTLNKIYVENIVEKKNYIQYDINGKGNGSQDQRAFYLKGKSGTLDTGCKSKIKVLIEKDKIKRLTRTEFERLQTVPIGYTSVVSYSQACNMIGNGWTVDVIAHIFKGIKEDLTCI